jgi:quercetin dioxygenase-like cupin family protein
MKLGEEKMADQTKKSVHEPIYGKPQALDALASYQKDSIVSTRIIQKDTGNITFFAFDEDQELSEHTAPFDALISVVDGSVKVKVGENWNSLKAGDAIILPANIPHAVKAETRFKMMLTMIRS